MHTAHHLTPQAASFHLAAPTPRRRVSLLLEQLAHELHGSRLVPPRLDQQVEYLAFAVDGPHRAVIDESLDFFPRLKPLLGSQGGQLSGGAQQLLALARCLCTRPKLILLDEPTEGIQPSIIEEIVDVLQRLRARTSVAMILLEQNVDFNASLASRDQENAHGGRTSHTPTDDGYRREPRDKP
jgi:ABC-type dipeptide/oligopeptide/nickel transport system ATPase subunit